MKGRRVCWLHGGKTPRGVASPHYKGVGFSKDLPSRLAKRYEDALKDTDLLSVSHGIAATRARLGELYSKLDTGESGLLWRDLGKAERQLRIALAANDERRADHALAEMRDLVQRGSAEASVHAETRQLEDHWRKLVDTEQRLLLMKQQTVTVKELNTWLGVIIDAIRRHVTAEAEPQQARRILTALTAEFERIGSLEPSLN